MKVLFVSFLAIFTLCRFIKEKGKDIKDLYFSLFLFLVLLSLTSLKYLIFTNIGIIISVIILVLVLYAIIKGSLELLQDIITIFKKK